ncbi:uncharacterized protein JCM6883_006534 [Sporobolomyces salmoneus]|uniref:uncharacterized protein n=1 Tax=Sporobolomyces salmoneus TaxID=183962 RepID=UPI003170D6BC
MVLRVNLHRLHQARDPLTLIDLETHSRATLHPLVTIRLILLPSIQYLPVDLLSGLPRRHGPITLVSPASSSSEPDRTCSKPTVALPATKNPRSRHSVSFALSHDESRMDCPKEEKRTSLVFTDSPPSEPLPPPSPSTIPIEALPLASPPRQQSVPTSIVRCKVDNEKEYELSKLVGKERFEEALQDDNLVKEFRDFFLTHHYNADLLNLYLDLRSFTSQSLQLHSLAASILLTFFSESSSSHLPLPISLRAPVFHSLTPLSKTTMEEIGTLETAERELFGRIHETYFEEFMQERLVGMGADSLSRAQEDDTVREWEKRGLGKAFCLINSRLEDNPIVLASEGFAELTGYSINELVGSNCRTLLQGPSTSPYASTALRDAIHEGQSITKLILHYRQNGEPFYTLFSLVPLRNRSGRGGEIDYFLVGSCDVTDLLYPLNTKPPQRSEGTEERLYERVVVASLKAGKVEVGHVTEEVNELFGMEESSTELVGVDLLDLLSNTAHDTASTALGSTGTKEEEASLSRSAIAEAIRRGEPWRGAVELNRRGTGGDRNGHQLEDSEKGEESSSCGSGRTVKCVLHLAFLKNEEGESKMVIAIFA